MKLRIQGWTFAAIADHLGLQGSGVVSKALDIGLAEYRADIQAKAAELRAMELARLDDLTEKLWGMYAEAEEAKTTGELGGANLFQLQVIDRLLKVIERRGRLLGLEKAIPEDTGQAPWALVLASLVGRAVENATGQDNGGAVPRVLDTRTVPAIEPPQGHSTNGAAPNRSSNKRGTRRRGSGADPDAEED